MVIDRQLYDKGAPLTRLAQGGNMPVMALHDPPADCQTHPCPGELGLLVESLERREYTFEVLGLKPDAVI